MNKKPLTINEYALVKISPERLCNLIFNASPNTDFTSNSDFRTSRKLLSSVLMALCVLRDDGKLRLNKKSILEHLEADKLLSLMQGKDILMPKKVFFDYATELPEILEKNEFSKATLDKHNYFRDLVVKKVDSFPF
jgi:hypothetical protein